MAEQQSRVLHVLQTARAEGTPRLVIDWLNSGYDGIDQSVMILHDSPSDLLESIKATASEVICCSTLSTRLGKYARISSEVYRICRRLRPDVLICWTTGFSHWVGLGARAAGVRRLVVHAGNPARHDLWGKAMTYYCTWPLWLLGADVVCCSRYVERSFTDILGVPKGLFRAVHNCCSAHTIEQRAACARLIRDSSRPTGLMVATLEEHKDHSCLLAAVPIILKSIPSFQLLLAGDGSLHSDISSTIDALRLRDHVSLLGTRDDVPELLGNTDVFILSTTEQEGFASVLIEAMAAAVPIVATDVPACRETLQDGALGVLIPPKDPAALAEGIVRTVLGRESVLPRQREDATHFARCLTATHMIDQYLMRAVQ